MTDKIPRLRFGLVFLNKIPRLRFGLVFLKMRIDTNPKRKRGNDTLLGNVKLDWQSLV